MEMDRFQKEVEEMDSQEEVGQDQEQKKMVQEGLEEMENHDGVDKTCKKEEVGHDLDQELVVQENWK